MAFERNQLAKVSSSANTNANAVWMYTTTDAMTVVRAADYFLTAINEIRLNDVIICVTATDGTPVITIAYCNANSGTAIDVTDGLVVTATDTD